MVGPGDPGGWSKLLGLVRGIKPTGESMGSFMGEPMELAIGAKTGWIGFLMRLRLLDLRLLELRLLGLRFLELGKARG